MLDLIDDFLASNPYSANTKASYHRVLVRLIKLPDLATLSAAALLDFVSLPTWGNSQRYVALGACRQFLRFAFGETHPALRARIKRQRPKMQRTLDHSHALELLASFDPRTPKGARDLALAALALDTGLRCSELCHLLLEDTDLDRRILQVVVKGGQWGTGVFSPHTAQYLSAWLAFRKPATGVHTLFVSVKTGKCLTREGLQTIMKRWGAKIGIKLSPHDLRRSFATLSTIFGAPSRVVQCAGRWSNIAMVEVYTRSLDQAAIAPYLPLENLISD